MGAVRCGIHGHQAGGPMTCRHLSGDVWSGENIRPFQEFTGDFFDDGKMVLRVALCTDCVVIFCASEQVALDSQILESVDPVPVCAECWRTLCTSMLVKPHC
jgi:hypothetical protein